MQTIRYELIAAQGAEGQVATITFDEANSPVNTMCQQWQHELGEVTAQVLGDREHLGAEVGQQVHADEGDHGPAGRWAVD